MDCTDFVVLAFLLMACGTTLAFAHEKKELNEKCLIYKECNTIGYKCGQNRTCQCTAGYIPNESWTKCVGYVGSKCFYDKHCIEGAYCTGSGGTEFCQCREQESFYVSEDGLTCANSAIHHKISFSMLLILLCSSLYLNT